MAIALPPPPPAIVIQNDGGGLVNTYINKVERYSAEGREVRIMGSCRSACVLYLGAKNVCVGPNAVVKAHQAYEQDTGQLRPDVTLYMMNQLPVKVSARLYPYVTKHYNPQATLDADQLASLGIKRCSPQDTVTAKDRKADKPIEIRPGDPITKALFYIFGVKK